MHGIGHQVSAGSNFQAAVVRLANYRANTVRDTTGLCECSGGNGHCTGCDALPVFQTRSRVPGDDGIDGRSGEKPVEPLFPGKDGRPGEAMIIVTSGTAGVPDKQYRSRYQLELVDFDVEDENDDGIFEPGEHLYIRRIRVKNTGKHFQGRTNRCLVITFKLGGLPSPTRNTRIEVDASDCLHSITGKDGSALVPSIPAGFTITLPGSIKALIREPDIPLFGGEVYRKATKISLKATMPGLNRRLDHFNYQKSIKIQYPLELQHIDYLQSVAQGSENKISMRIYNRGNKVFGAGRAPLRRAELKISIPSESGTLLTASGTWSPEVSKESGKIGAETSVKILQTSKISHRAKDHAYTTIHVEFFISSPGPIPAIGRGLGDLGIPMCLTQSFDLKIQISATHVYDEQAGILIVTNVKTPPDQFEAIGEFIRKDLCLKMDVWNVSQYGGLIQQEQNEEDEESSRNILSEYHGRTIIFLGNKFEHFGVKGQTIINLCESQVIANECFAGSSFLLLGAAAGKNKRDAWLKNSVFPVSHTISDFPNQVTQSSTFDNVASLTRSISEQRTSANSVSQAYQVEIKPKWYYGGAKMTVKRQAKLIQNHLRAKLPQERFWVCPVYPRIDGRKMYPGYVAVWHGLPSKGNIFATESKELQKERGRPPKLHPFDSFNIICSLPCLLRVRLLCSFDKEPAAAMEEKNSKHVSITSQDSANYSDDILDAVQFSLEEDVSNEIRDYLSPSPAINNISLGASKDPTDQFSVHFPCVETILEQFEASDNTSARALEILRIAIAVTNPQNKRQVVRSITAPIGQRRAQLKSYLIRRVEAILKDKGYFPAGLKEFRITAQAKHSRFSSSKRDILKQIEERNRMFAKVPTNEYKKGRRTTKDLVQGTQMCTEAEWDARFREIEKTKTSLKRSVTRAVMKRGKMSTLNLKSTPELERNEMNGS
jgi:hypothetical protein